MLACILSLWILNFKPQKWQNKDWEILSDVVKRPLGSQTETSPPFYCFPLQYAPWPKWIYLFKTMSSASYLFLITGKLCHLIYYLNSLFPLKSVLFALRTNVMWWLLELGNGCRSSQPGTVSSIRRLLRTEHWATATSHWTLQGRWHV